MYILCTYIGSTVLYKYLLLIPGILYYAISMYYCVAVHTVSRHSCYTI